MPNAAPRLRKRGGYTLLEIMVSVLLTSIMVTSVLTVALSARQGGGRADRKMAAATGLRELQATVKNFHRDQTGNTSGIAGPGPGGTWTIDGLPGGGGGTIDDLSCVNCNAMNVGTHTVRGILPSWFEAAPYSANLRYIVFAGSPPRVEFAIDWTEP